MCCRWYSTRGSRPEGRAELSAILPRVAHLTATRPTNRCGKSTPTPAPPRKGEGDADTDASVLVSSPFRAGLSNMESHRPLCECLLPLWEKVAEGRMRGISPRTGSFLASLGSRYTSLRVPLIRPSGTFSHKGRRQEVPIALKCDSPPSLRGRDKVGVSFPYRPLPSAPAGNGDVPPPKNPTCRRCSKTVLTPRLHLTLHVLNAASEGRRSDHRDD